jgi:hypothetical protein
MPERKSEPVTEAKVKLSCHVVAYDKYGNKTGERFSDMGLKALAQFIQALILASNQSVTDTSNNPQTVSNGTATSTLQVVAGTDSTAASFTQYHLLAQSAGSSGYVAATVNAISGSSFTVTGTITNGSGSTINYAEVGIYVTNAAHIFCLARDAFTALPVSDQGTLAVTYTFSFT